MTPEQRAQAIEYSTTKNILYFAGTFFSFSILIIILFTGLSARMRGWAERVSKNKLVELALYLLLFRLIVVVARLPFLIYGGYVVEHKYGHSTQDFTTWLFELFKSQAIGWVVIFVVLALVYLALRWYPRTWWMHVGAGAAPVIILFVVIAPLIISPMFNTFTPIRDTELGDRIQALAERAGIGESTILEVDASRQSHKYNAYVTGLFGAKRIVLYDNMLNHMEHDETLFIMGHEIGHYVKYHIWLGVLGGTMFVFLASWFIARVAPGLIERHRDRWKIRSLSDVASVPLLLLLFSMLNFLALPVANGISRHYEHTADVYGLTLTDNREAAARAFEKLAARNLSNPDPSPFIKFWLYSHPTIKDRVNYVLESESP